MKITEIIKGKTRKSLAELALHIALATGAIACSVGWGALAYNAYKLSGNVYENEWQLFKNDRVEFLRKHPERLVYQRNANLGLVCMYSGVGLVLFAGIKPLFSEKEVNKDATKWI